MLPVVVGIEGLELTAAEREVFTRLQPAGYILFSRNISDYELTRELTDELRAITEGPDAPIIAIDEEGGRVVRTAEIGVHFPSAAALGDTGSEHRIKQAAYYNARCLLTLGVNTNLAPVLDIGSTRANALPGRCWGTDSQVVTSYGGVWNQAHRHLGIITCGKHFPGMGKAECDPHFDLPVLHATKDEFLQDAAIPFLANIDRLPSMMTAHLLIPEIDPELPTSLSPALVQEFLRRQLGYKGVVFTDDLCMGAISKRYTPAQSVPMALRAGCDLPLLCHNVLEHIEDVADAVAALPMEILDAAYERISDLRMEITTLPPMRFIEWNDYLRDLRDFCAKIPEPAAAQVHSSPVQDY